MRWRLAVLLMGCHPPEGTQEPSPLDTGPHGHAEGVWDPSEAPAAPVTDDLPASPLEDVLAESAVCWSILTTAHRLEVVAIGVDTGRWALVAFAPAPEGDTPESVALVDGALWISGPDLRRLDLTTRTWVPMLSAPLLRAIAGAGVRDDVLALITAPGASSALARFDDLAAVFGGQSAASTPFSAAQRTIGLSAGYLWAVDWNGTTWRFDADGDSRSFPSQVTFPDALPAGMSTLGLDRLVLLTPGDREARSPALRRPWLTVTSLEDGQITHERAVGRVGVQGLACAEAPLTTARTTRSPSTSAPATASGTP